MARYATWVVGAFDYLFKESITTPFEKKSTFPNVDRIQFTYGVQD